MKKSLLIVGVLALAILKFSSCTFDKAEFPNNESGYPEEIRKIIVSKCATVGCHDDKSKEAAGGLSQQTWNKLVEQLILQIRNKNLVEGLCLAISECGRILSEKFPIKPDDENEIKDGVIIE